MRAFWIGVFLLGMVGLWFVFASDGVTGPQSGSTQGSSGEHGGEEAATNSIEPPMGLGETASARANSNASTNPKSDATSKTRPSGDPSTSVNTAPPTGDAISVGSTAPTTTATTTATTITTATDTPAPDFDLLGEAGLVIKPSAPAPRALRTDTRSPAEVVRRLDDRTLELDGRYRVTGNGSANDPYVISWELLTSASEFIDLAQDARTPPPWVRLLDGTYIQISGYYSTAIRVTVAKNLLLTLNRWDGCCIGVPPTAFDAIDITMREALPMGGMHLTRFGTFRGQLRVEPVDAAGFLLGLYRLEDATFETK